MRPTGGKFPDLAPVRPPLAQTKPCAKCATGKAIGRKRLCDACRKESHREKNREWAVNRTLIVSLERRITQLERMVGFGCRVGRQVGKEAQ